MTVYDFTVKNSDGKEISLGDYKGKVLLIVNTASNCGYTKQLLGLEREYKSFKDQGLEILALPCNQFKGQEPGSMDEIVKFYQGEYNVTFPILGKIDVNGSGEDPLYKFLKETIGFDPKSDTPPVMIPHYKDIDPNYESSSDIKWNFTKFLIDREGKPLKRFEPEVTPSNLVEDIKAAL